MSVRLVYLGNNRLAYRCLEWLLERGGCELCGLVLHRRGEARYADELRSLAALPDERLFCSDDLDGEAGRRRLAALDPELGLSVLYGHKLGAETLGLFPAGVANLHPALLPYNRGAYPNVWSIIDRTPAGVTLHAMDAGLDTGDILAQRRVEVRPTDTGESLYQRLEEAAFELLRDSWPELAAGTLAGVAQGEGGTSHRRRDVDAVDRIDLEASYTGGELIDILRARTFPPHRGAYFESDGRRVYMRLELREEGDAEAGADREPEE